MLIHKVDSAKKFSNYFQRDLIWWNKINFRQKNYLYTKQARRQKKLIGVAIY
jgi:hypothetical protein